MAYDINPAISTQDKKRILELILEKNLKIIFEHDPLFLGASIKKDEKQKMVVNKTIDAIEALAYEL
jgi:hypothetical protein